MKTASGVILSRLQMRNFLSRLKESSFFRNVLVVMSGTAVAQVIGFALSPVISRLFSPADFGVFGSFNSVSTIIAVGATLQYSQAIVLPRKDEDALSLFLVSCLSTFLVGLLSLTVCLFIPGYVNGLMQTDGVWALMLLIAATIVYGLGTSCQAWCIRLKCFKHTSASQVIRSLSSSGSQIAFGFFKVGAAGLIVASVLADMLASLNLVRVVLSDIKALRQGIQWSRMIQLAKEYLDFPMYSASQNVINALSSGLPVLLLTHFYGIETAGAYAFGVRILQIPMGFILTSLRQVLFQRASEAQHQGERLTPLYTKITFGLFTVILFPSLVLFIWAPQLFKVIFGSEWYVAGEYAQWLIFWLMFYFCNLPAVLFAQIIRIQRTIFFYDLVLLVARVSTLVLGGLYLNALHTVMLFSVVGAAMNAVLVLLVGNAVMSRESTATQSISEVGQR